jgi:hypothetical protein
LSIASKDSEPVKQYCQNLKHTFGSIPRKSSVSNDIVIQGFSLEGTRTVVISAFWCMDGDQDHVNLLFRHQEVIEIPFSSPFLSSFDIKECPRAVIEPVDEVGLFRPTVLKFDKHQSWLIASKFQNKSNSALVIMQMQICINSVNVNTAY